MQVRQLPLSKKNVSELVVRIANNSHSSEWFFIAMNDCWWPICDIWVRSPHWIVSDPKQTSSYLDICWLFLGNWTALR